MAHSRCTTLAYHHEQDNAIYDGVREVTWPSLAAFESARDGGGEGWAALSDPALIDPKRSRPCSSRSTG